VFGTLLRGDNVEFTQQELPVCQFQFAFRINTSMDFISPIRSRRDFFFLVGEGFLRRYEPRFMYSDLASPFEGLCVNA